jgi:hypothetical protein
VETSVGKSSSPSSIVDGSGGMTPNDRGSSRPKWDVPTFSAVEILRDLADAVWTGHWNRSLLTQMNRSTMQSSSRVFSTTVALPSRPDVIGDDSKDLVGVLVEDLLRYSVQVLKPFVVAPKGLVDVVLREIFFVMIAQRSKDRAVAPLGPDPVRSQAFRLAFRLKTIFTPTLRCLIPVPPDLRGSV